MSETALQVMLPPEYDEQLKKHIASVLNEVVTSVRRQTAIDSPWLSSKAAIAKWLGLSDGTLTILIKSGLPVHYLPNVDKTVGNKREITEWMLKQ
ncbi:MAG TPA: hypothetical protein H9875_06895 [Candidatus Levilactobacillus faecigallinarum]|uniref:Uncharacterized protein n=1 Tax=Candidatus Levilactobacillus faecigallinarum TaxID=2838638 RepID=A0A9D1QT51_9LACO|nr:hypothetical protein [Candidatus Levilactobacillus faecigallinarum]